jgi:hypothetical protein
VSRLSSGPFVARPDYFPGLSRVTNPLHSVGIEVFGEIYAISAKKNFDKFL